MNILFKNRNFFLLWLGQTISVLGGWINYVGLNVLLYEASGSGKLLGAFFAARFIPALFFAPIGGYLADKYNKRKLMIFCDICRALLVLTFVFTKNIALFFVIGFILSVFDKIYSSSAGAILPDIIEKENLLKANSLTRISQSVTGILGPAVGGLLIGLWSYKAVFLADSASYFISVITLLFIVYLPQEGRERKRVASKPFFADLAYAFKFLMTSTLLLWVAVIRMVDAFGSGAFNTMFPIVSTKITMASGTYYGWVVTAYGLGTLLGASLTPKIRPKFKDITLYCMTTLIMGIGLGGSFLMPNPVAGLILIALGGFGEGISGVLFSTLIMEKIPKEILGKIYGTLTSFVYVLCGVGMMVAGLFVDFTNYLNITNAGLILILAFTVLAWAVIASSDVMKEEKK